MKFPDSNPITQYDYTLRSRYGETDKMGYVYHGKYLEYFEVARTEMIRSYGISYRKMEDDGIMLPVINTQIDFKAPVYYDEEMVIRVLIYEAPGIRMRTYYQVFAKERDTLCVEGMVTLCFMSEKDRRPCRAPKYFLERFNAAVYQ